MDPEIIAAFSGVIAAITGLVIAVTALWRTLKENTRTTNATHDLVNNKADEQTVRLDQLTHALTDRGVPVPVDPAIGAAARRADQEAAGDPKGVIR